MKNNTELILLEAEELAKSIKEHPLAISYNKSTEKLNGDFSSQKLLSRLIMAGKDLNENANSKEKKSFGAEHQLIREELDQNLFLKSHLQIQKEYLNLINQIMEKIKNPVDLI